MSRLGDATKKASRRYIDVPIVLDGELIQERKALLNAVLLASSKPERVSVVEVPKAQAALDEWNAAHVDDVETIRVRSCTSAEWKAIRLKYPLPKNPEERDPFDLPYGYQITPVAVEAIETQGRILAGDVEETPTLDEWKALWEAVSPGDMTQLVLAVINANAENSTQAFPDLVKASTLNRH